VRLAHPKPVGVTATLRAMGLGTHDSERSGPRISELSGGAVSTVRVPAATGRGHIAGGWGVGASGRPRNGAAAGDAGGRADSGTRSTPSGGRSGHNQRGCRGLRGKNDGGFSGKGQ
jgi:hypothetical protein